MLHSSVHIQIFTERNSINVSLSRVGLHECHGKQHINTAVGLDSPRNGADNILTLAGDDRAGLSAQARPDGPHWPQRS